jgi:pyruvate,water dikinase
MRYVLRGDEAEVDAPLGGKARALAALRDAELPIPPWVALTPDAFVASLTPAQLASLEAGPDAAGLRALVAAVEPAPEVRAELRAALRELCPGGEPAAVRSSASDEDGPQHSFAGQLDSFLFVPPDLAPARAADVWRSAFSERIVAYRREHGLGPTPRPPAVLIQRMVRPDAAGVAFGADPVGGRRGVAVVAAVLGCGTALVSGECDADTFHVDRDGRIVGRAVADKKVRHVADPAGAEGVRAEPLPPDAARAPALTDEQVRAVADLARRAGNHFGRPQDVEWAIEDGKLYLLQSRPITSLAGAPDPDGVRNLWDNSNIAESYNGVTTPLTFSFARRAYEEVYRQFCRLLGVPRRKIEQSDDVFRRMLGLVRGRVYYNLLNWYRLLALLPGFTVNRRFMEQMMGVRQGLPDELVEELGQASLGARVRDAVGLLGSLAAIVGHHFSLSRQIKAFYQRLNGALGPSRPDLGRLRPDEIVAEYRRLERELLSRWDAPLVNDFFAMIFYGLLRRLVEKWCGGRGGTLHNDLLCGEGGMISAEPARRVRALADAARAHPDLLRALCDGTRPEALRAAARVPEFRRQLESYLDQFGDRCLEELKLESPTLRDDPLPLLRAVGQLARRPGGATEAPGAAPEAELRRRAEARAAASLAGQPLRRLLFGWVLKHARARVRDRENLRFERTRLFGRARDLFVELGRKIHADGLLDEPRDVFYLEVNEALGFVDGTATTTDLKGLAALRKAEFTRYRSGEAPADRFETRGAVHQGNAFRGGAAAAGAGPAGDRLQGLGCCPGVVRGRARVVTDPRGATLSKGDVLVAERTDPGWIMLFPCAAGLLVERGSLLSHSAIVAREMGIPAVVALDGVTRWLKDGDWVELDGAAGVVVKLPPPQPEPSHGQ